MNKLYLLLISGMMVSLLYGSEKKTDQNKTLAERFYNHHGITSAPQQHYLQPIKRGSSSSKRPSTSHANVEKKESVKRSSSSLGGVEQSLPKVSSASNSEAIERFAKVGSQMLGGSSHVKRTTALKDFARDLEDAGSAQSVMPLFGLRAGRNISSRQNDIFSDQERVASVPRTLQKRTRQNISQGVSIVGQEGLTGNKAVIGSALSKQEIKTAQRLALIESDVDTTRPSTLDEWLRCVASITHKNEEVVNKQREYDSSFDSIEQTINSLKKEVGHLVNQNPSFLSDQKKIKVARLKDMKKSLEETRSVLTVNLLDFRREKLREALSQKRLRVDKSDLKKHEEGTWIHNFVLMALMGNDEKNK